MVSNRLSVLHAKSGAGKTSLLNAGISPRFIREGRLPLYVRAYEDPILALKRLIAPALPGPWPQLLHTLTLHEFLGLVCRYRNPQIQEVIVILDQFEQFFLLWSQREDRCTFIKELGICYDDQSLPLRFVIALRKDYYSDLAEFERILPHLPVFQNRNQHCLEAVTAEEARATITGPLATLGISVTYDSALLRTLLADLAHFEMELPLLQIICTRLYETRGKDEAQITLKTYEALGHAEGVLSHYFNDVLAHLLGNEEVLARSVLKELVRSDGMKQMLSYKTLAARVETQGSELGRVLDRLVNARLLRRDEMAGKITYELAHEYLTREIVKWINSADQEFKQAEELLEREVISWHLHHILIPKKRLEVLYSYREQFKGLKVKEWKCLLSSALEENFAIADWASAAGEIGEIFLLQTLEDSNVEMRRRGATALGKLGIPRAAVPLIVALKATNTTWENEDSDELQIDETPTEKLLEAILGALANIREPAVEPLIAALKDESDVMRSSAAARALGKIGDPQAVEPLIAALKDGDPWVQCHSNKKKVWKGGSFPGKGEMPALLATKGGKGPFDDARAEA